MLAVLGDARDLGFLGPGPIEAHVEHALGFHRAIEKLGRELTNAVDLGSGGGVPGLVLALVMPATRWLLVETMVKRTAFLSVAVQTLGLEDRVTVYAGRAEDAARSERGQAQLVVARSFGAPAVLAECAAPLLAVGGHLIVSEPPGGDPGRWPAGPLRSLGLVVEEIDPGPPALATLAQFEAAPAALPRQAGLAAKHPRW